MGRAINQCLIWLIVFKVIQLEVNVWSGVEIDVTPCKINGYVPKFPIQTPPLAKFKDPREISTSWCDLFKALKPWHVSVVWLVRAFKFKVELALIKFCLELNNEFVLVCV